MSYRTMKIAISDEEMQALTEMAASEYRRPTDQARYILRRALLNADQEKHNDAVSIRQDTHGAVAAIAG